jgi:DNA replication protein
MKRFGGFPPRMQFTAVPEPFFSHLLPEIDDIAELKIVLAVIRQLYHKKGYPKFVSNSELLADASLMAAFTADAAPAETVLQSGLKKAIADGILLSLAVTQGDIRQDIYVLNTDADRQLLSRIESGEVTLPGLKAAVSPVIVPESRPDIFSLYEANIGLITPLIADEIKAALRDYPESWLVDAIKEAANQNKRKWSYISAILERWGSEGRADGTYRRDTKKADPDKYIKGKYGHMVQR